MTSCTCGTGVPKKCPSRKKVKNCCVEAMTLLLGLCRRVGEVRNCAAHHARHIQQVGDTLLNDGRAENSPALGGTLLYHQFFLHNVHDAVYDQAHTSPGLGIHHHLDAGVPAAAAASLPVPATIPDRRMSGMISPRYCITSCGPANSISVTGNSSSLATSDNGMAMRP